MAATRTLKGYGFTGFGQFSLSLLKPSKDGDKQSEHTEEERVSLTDYTVLELPCYDQNETVHINSTWDNMFVHLQDQKVSYASKKWFPLLLEVMTTCCTSGNETIARVWPVGLEREEREGGGGAKGGLEEENDSEIDKGGGGSGGEREGRKELKKEDNSFGSGEKEDQKGTGEREGSELTDSSLLYLVQTTSNHCYLVRSSTTTQSTSITLIHRYKEPLFHCWSPFILNNGATGTIKPIIYYVTLSGNLYKTTSSELLETQASLSLEKPFFPLIKVTSVANGPTHSLLLTNTGLVYSFGLGGHGELGHGDLESQDTPILIEALGGIGMRGVACGRWHSLAVSGCGDVYSWGWNQHGQLGHGHAHSVVSEPSLVEAIPEEVEIVKVTCGSRHSAAVSKNDGKCYVWGWNGYGQIPNYKDGDIVRLPVLLKDMIVDDVICCHWSTIISTINQK